MGNKQLIRESVSQGQFFFVEQLVFRKIPLTHRFHIDHITPCVPHKFSITIIFDFS